MFLDFRGPESGREQDASTINAAVGSVGGARRSAGGAFRHGGTAHRGESANLRIRRAGFRSSKTLGQFDFDVNRAIDQSLITELANCRFVAEKVAILIAGPCSTGESHIAQATGHASVRADYDVLFSTQSQLLASVVSHFSWIGAGVYFPH